MAIRVMSVVGLLLLREAAGSTSPKDLVREIRFQGNATIATDDLKSRLKTRAGQPFDLETVEVDRQSLLKTNWFSDVQVCYEATDAGQDLILIIEVEEMPVLQSVEFRGIDDAGGVTLGAIEEATGLKKGARADLVRAQLALHLIRELYREKQYPDAEVTLVEWSKGDSGRVVIVINAGPRAPEFVPVAVPIVEAKTDDVTDFFDLNQFKDPVTLQAKFRAVSPPVIDKEESTRLALKQAEAERYRLRGQQHQAKGLNRRAIAELSRAISLGRSDAESYLDRSHLLSEEGDYERAMADIETALSLIDLDDIAWRETALLYRGVLFEKQGKLELALESYDQARGTRPPNHRDLVYRGTCLCKLGRYDEAIAVLDQAIEAKPVYLALFIRGDAYFHLGRYDLACADFDRALQEKPGDVWSLVRRGIAREKLHQDDAAITDFYQALAKYPNFDEALLARGWANLDENRLDLALEDFEKVTGQGTEKIFCFGGWGKSLQTVPKFDLPITDFLLAREADPTLRQRLFIYREAEGRTHLRQDPVCCVYWVVQTRSGEAVGPDFIVGFEWTRQPRTHLAAASLGSGITLIRKHEWRAGLDNLYSALEVLIPEWWTFGK